MGRLFVANAHKFRPMGSVWLEHAQKERLRVAMAEHQPVGNLQGAEKMNNYITGLGGQREMCEWLTL